MISFALITEGVSEHTIIKKIINTYFKGFDVFPRQIQPEIKQGRQAGIGGWNEVLKYCKCDEVQDILAENDYLIIQIDTDQSQQSPFNVDHFFEGIPKTHEQLFYGVREKLLSLIQQPIFEKYADKIIFAICIHSTECWLLPIYYSDIHRTHTNNCLETLNRVTIRNNIRRITNANKNKANGIRAYESILSNWRRKADIISVAQYNYGFTKFIDSLDLICTTGHETIN